MSELYWLVQSSCLALALALLLVTPSVSVLPACLFSAPVSSRPHAFRTPLSVLLRLRALATSEVYNSITHQLIARSENAESEKEAGRGPKHPPAPADMGERAEGPLSERKGLRAATATRMIFAQIICEMPRHNCRCFHRLSNRPCVAVEARPERSRRTR